MLNRKKYGSNRIKVVSALASLVFGLPGLDWNSPVDHTELFSGQGSVTIAEVKALTNGLAVCYIYIYMYLFICIYICVCMYIYTIYLLIYINRPIFSMFYVYNMF